MARARLAATVVSVALLCGCGAAPHCGGFDLTLGSDRGGQPSPVLASERFARNGTFAHIPHKGWHLDGNDDTGVFTRSGPVRLHVIQNPDKTWQVNAGTCGR